MRKASSDAQPSRCERRIVFVAALRLLMDLPAGRQTIIGRVRT
jgi:hypothetical protein